MSNERLVGIVEAALRAETDVVGRMGWREGAAHHRERWRPEQRNAGLAMSVQRDQNSDPEDRAQAIIQEGRPEAIIGMAMRARAAYEEGRTCQCPEPILAGQDLMCGRCLLENQAQRDAREAAMRAPHIFVPRGDGFKARMCKVCSGWTDDPRHVEAAQLEFSRRTGLPLADGRRG